MSDVIVGRSDQQIDEDNLCNLHKFVSEELNMLCGNLGLLYVGEQRLALEAFKAKLDALILGGESVTAHQVMLLSAQHTHILRTRNPRSFF